MLSGPIMLEYRSALNTTRINVIPTTFTIYAQWPCHLGILAEILTHVNVKREDSTLICVE